MLGDIDYKAYLGDDAPSVTQSAREFVNDLVWKYTSVLMAQPFEVAKTILQAQDQNPNALSLGGEDDPFKAQYARHGLAIHDVCLFPLYN